MIEYFIKSKNGNINVIEGLKILNPKAIILNIHGIGSHFQFVYPSLDEFINRDNFYSNYDLKSFAFEFYGHGKSEGTKCFINDFDNLLFDLETVIQYIKDKYSNLKIFICAESMGGAVVLKYLTNNNNVNGVILLSPMCGIDDKLKPSPFITNILLPISYWFPKLKLAFTTTNMGNQSVINQEFIDAKNNCKYNYKGIHRLGTVREMYKISLWIPDNTKEISTPLLLFHGLNDKITTPKGSEKVFKNINSLNKELILLPDTEHCLLIPNTYDDLTPNFIYAKTLNWIEKYL